MLLFLILLFSALGPVGFTGSSQPVDVTDGTLDDWDDAPVKLYDALGETNVAQTDLAFVSFDYDDTWLYVRWDVFDNLSYSPQVLYDMGINLTGNLSGTDDDWDIYVSTETDRIGGIPVLVNISIRDSSNNHIWNASDDGNMSQDGSLYFDPTPGLPPGNLSVEARFPLASLGLPTGVIFGQFRSHPSTSVESVVKDRVPDSGFIIIVIDNNPPQISNLDATPDPQENGGSVNITVNATDDLGIGGIWVNITNPDGSWTNVSMLNGSIDEWFLEDIFDDLGDYTITVWANDTLDNWATLGPETFTIVDTEGPIIDNLAATPNPQENGDFVNITVDVTDDIAVDMVWIEIQYPNGSTINTTMEKGPGDRWYFEAQYDELGDYTYTIWANDTINNWNSQGPQTFTIEDTDPPELSDLTDSPDPQEMGEFLNITVNVIDDVGIDKVWVRIRYPNGTSIDLPMEPGADSEWFIKMPFTEPGIYVYHVEANDTSGNLNSTELEGFIIVDLEDPEIEDPKVIPNPQIEDGYVNITANITDNVEIINVWINITFPNGTWINDTMNPTDSDIWYYNETFLWNGNYTYTIWVEDSAGNTNSSEPEIFSIIPGETPETPPPPLPPPLPPPGIPKALYMSVLLIFWPLLLIMFTVLVERRYGFGNRARKEIEPIVATYMRYPDRFRKLILLSQKAAIPPEEFFVTALTLPKPPDIQDRINNQILEDMKRFAR
jgi:hypothetical protein